LGSSASSKDRILEAAGQVFREKGFAGASMQVISRKAGVSKSLLYHHFNSKQELWRAMVEQCFQRSGILERFYSIVSSGDMGSLADFARGEEGLFHFLGRNPGVVRMMNWLDLEGGFETGFPDPCSRDRVLERIREMAEKGVIRADIDPVVLPIVYMSICVNWFSARWKYLDWFGGEKDPESIDRRFISGAIDILLRGMTPDEKK
jgi:TetR/AcrR family transcriptional regulator